MNIIESGSLKAKDKMDNTIILEWQMDTMFAKKTIWSMASLWECAREAYLPIEVDFLKAFPDVVYSDLYYQPFKNIFKQGSNGIDWKEVSIVMEDVLKNHFIIDITNIPKSIIDTYSNDQSIIVTLKDEVTKELLGFMHFMVRSTYSLGTVKVIAAGVIPFAQNRGLGKIMMASLFKIVPEVKNIFLSTRITNKQALHAYAAWGFIQDNDCMQDPIHQLNLKHWVFMKYDTTEMDTLQKVAKTLMLQIIK